MMKKNFPLILSAVCVTPLVVALSQDQAFAASGKQTYSQVCASCHDSGAMGAPKFGSKADWAPRIKQGKQTLYQNAITGIGAMPPKGGQPSLSDKDVQAAVDYMVAAASGGGGGGKQASGGGGGKQASGGGGMPTDEQLVKASGSGLVIQGGPIIKNPLAGNKNAVASGETLFAAMNCIGCHAPEAGGGMGPPLGDVSWIYGDSPADIYLTISNGRPNGMPSYGYALPPQSIWTLVSYIQSLSK
jgi:cytochrome c oxidase cbb3-type subunit III